MWLVVGLGNPGEKYEWTRHNIGFLALDRIFRKHNNGLFKTDFSGLTVKGVIGSESVVFLKPQTFMNNSGRSVSQAANFYKIAPQNIILLHDDLDLVFGDVRVKQSGGHGGHNGLRDTIANIGPEFFRVRIGIGRPTFKGSEVNYVLECFRKSDSGVLAGQIEDATSATEVLIAKGLEIAQRTFNGVIKGNN